MTPTHPDAAAFLAAIRAYPEDDCPRLQYADWLDEHDRTESCRGCGGHGTVHWTLPAGSTEPNSGTCTRCRGSGRVPNHYAARAEFIRVQVELAGIDSLVWANKLMHEVEWRAIRPTAETWGERFELTNPGDRIGVHHYRTANRRWDDLHEREWLLLCDHNEWCDLGDRWSLYTPGRESLTSTHAVTFRRGFAHTLRGPLAAFWGERECPECSGNGQVGTLVGTMGCVKCSPDYRTRGTGRVSGPTPAFAALLTREPVTDVVVTDREPADRTAINGEWYWFEDGRNALGHWSDGSHLPRSLFHLLPGATPDAIIGLPYPTTALARAALSAALLRAGGRFS